MFSSFLSWRIIDKLDLTTSSAWKTMPILPGKKRITFFELRCLFYPDEPHRPSFSTLSSICRSGALAPSPLFSFSLVQYSTPPDLTFLHLTPSLYLPIYHNHLSILSS